LQALAGSLAQNPGRKFERQFYWIEIACLLI
jgi:hypothetical protein